jgi:Glycosyltransferase family 87
VWAAFMMAGPIGIGHGQDCALFLAVIVGAFALGERGKPFLCGLVIGLGMVKFHLFLLWPLVLLVQKRWRMILGLATCGLAQLLISVAVIGWSGLQRYADFILHLDRYYSPELYINIGAIFLNLHVAYPPLLVMPTVVVAGLVLWSSRHAGQLWMTFALAGAGSLLVGPHVYGYDGTMLLVPAWCAIFLSGLPVLRLAAATICTPLPVLAAIAGPPAACFTACVLLVFTIALCMENRRDGRAERIVLAAQAPALEQYGLP